MHREDYKNQIELNHRFRDLYKKDFMKRLEFARDNGCNTIVLTGNGEPLCNHRFLEFFSEWNNQLRSSFKWIELQTSGVMLDDEKLRWLRNDIGVSTISLSLSDVFVSQKNYEYNGTPQNLQRDNFINHTCSEIKRYDFNLRLSLNMTDSYNKQSIDEIFKKCKELGANQITFRELYESPISETPENKWIRKHKIADKKLFAIKKICPN